MIQIIAGLTIGLIIGFAAPLIEMSSKLIAVVLIVLIDAAIDGFRAKFIETFDDKSLIIGLTLNLIVAVSLVYLGNFLGVNLHYIALFSLGVHIFKNLSVLKIQLFKKI